ncbi:hypothetical protein PMAC_002894 [Pneumocystis sp. 'macacae']|nr:hypothetical protein PMAC_002894 [Pneumocystis sp. 'macacae']
MKDSDLDYIDGETSSDVSLFEGKKNEEKTKKKKKQSKNVAYRLSHSDSTISYTWEKEYHRSWDIVQEDQQGSLATTLLQMTQAGKRKRILRDTIPLQRGIIRHLVLVLDLTISMEKRDLIPSRYVVSIDKASSFVSEYFEQNPLAQLGIVGMRDGRATSISPYGGNPHEHLMALNRLKQMDPSGNASLQNALEMARTILYPVPKHGTREVLLIFGSLTSFDPGDIYETIDILIEEKIRVYVIGLSASISICQKICKETNAGDESSYGIVLNEQHFHDLLMQFVVPPALKKSHKFLETLIMMGFPSKLIEKEETLCACHSNIIKEGYLCPRCFSKVCSLPINCPCCDLTLILSTHLARSYHHLFPLKNWIEVPWEEASSTHCYACLIPFPEKHEIASLTHSISISSRYACSECHKHFCIDCDVFAHEILFECIGCQSISNHKNQNKNIQ